MLKAEMDAYKNRLKTMDHDAVINETVSLFVKNDELEIRIKEMSESTHEMSLQFIQLKALAESREHEILELQKQIVHLTGVNASQTQEMYGKSSEKTSGIIKESASGSNFSDPLSEDAPVDDGNQIAKDDGKDRKIIKFSTCASRSVRRGKTRMDTSALPHVVIYDYDIDSLNEEYGEGAWRFFTWEKHEVMELVRQHSYVKEIYTPVISHGSYNELSRVPFEGRIIPGSKASSSLLSSIFCDNINLHLPYYRLEHDVDRYGISISRQNMSNWSEAASENLFEPVYDYLKNLLKSFPCQQCDETTYLVITERGNVINYIWVHRTSELANTDQIIIYCYDASRSADHLIKFYEGLRSHIYLTTDAYGAYDALENAFPGLITLCGCFMHARRRPVDSFRTKTKGLTDEEISELPEMKMIEIIAKTYEAEGVLKDLDANDRLNNRQKEVRPWVDEFFEYVHSLDENNPAYGEKLQDAIKYSKNHETTLRRFLEDGNIPIDNGACERSVKPVAAHRNNSMFSFTERGARATMIQMSLIETAKANDAIPYYYLKYLLEGMSGAVYYNHPYNMEDMLPWSDAYRTYEAEQRQIYPGYGIPPGNEKPKSPRKQKPQERETA